MPFPRTRLILTATALPAALFCGTAGASLTQRWSFSNAAGEAVDGTEIVNGAGGESAYIRGTGASFNGTNVVLPGGGSGTAPYVDLPNGIVSPLTTATIEAWVTVTGTANGWARFFDFGAGTAGEVFGPGSTFNGNNYLFLSAAVGGDYGAQQLEFRTTDATSTNFQVGKPVSVGTQIYFAITLDNASIPGQTIANYWRNGEHVGTDLVFPYDLNQLNDVNNWLGRSNWAADANLSCQFDEFRISDTAFTESQVLASRRTGTEELPVDADGDGLADAWEIKYFGNLSQAPNADADNDGSSNYEEYVRGTNPALDDTDGDGLKDGAEITAQTDPFNPDTDGDGLKDGAEITAGTDPLSRDSDGDQYGDATEVASGSNPKDANSIPVPHLTHRYSFSETSGRKIADSVGSAPGYIIGNGFSLANGSLDLAGGTSQAAAYAALPAGILSSNGIAKGGRGAVTLEGWVTVNSTAPGNWARIFDFGSSSPGGAQGGIYGTGDYNGGGNNGLDYLFLAAYRDADPNTRRVEFQSDDPQATGDQILANFVPTQALGEPFHFAVTYDESSGLMNYYENGVLVPPADIQATAPKLSDINDLNNWLGRSQYMSDATLDGTFNEFRIYDNALSPETIAAHAAAGPDATPVPAVALDSDNDGMPDWFENAYGFDPNSPADAALDADGDGLSNKDECLRGTNPRVADTDGDGLSDLVETNTGIYQSPSNTGTSPVSYDTDGDGVGDKAEIALGADPNNVASVPAQLVHQWHFNNPAGAAPAGTTTPDALAAGFDAVIQGNGAVFTGTGITIGGGPSLSAAYVDLPNNLLSPLTRATLECWVTVNVGGNTWARILDFGDTDANEIIGAGGTGNAVDSLFLSASNGDNYGSNRILMRNDAVETFWDFNVPYTEGSLQLAHYVVTIDSSVDTGSRLSVWRNGQVMASNLFNTAKLSDLHDVNNWLGRSNYLADKNLSGTYSEFRIYNGLLGSADVAKNYADGPEYVVPTGKAFSITGINRLSPTQVQLTWESEVGQVYLVQSSADLATPWAGVGNPITANGASTQTTVTVPANTTRIFFRIQRQ